MDMDTDHGRGPATVTSTEIIEGLNDLLQLDHDAIGAYQIAIDKLEDPDWRSQISGFLMDHERHVRELNEAVMEMGGAPVNEPHTSGPFKEALQSLGALGGDKGILVAWRTNELQVRTKYDSYASKAVFWPNHIKALIDHNALDEERHYRWVTDVLERSGVGTAEGLETGVATRLREGMASIDVEALKERAGEAVETARFRAADGLESAAERLDRLAAEQQVAGGARARAAGAAHRVADGMEAAAGYLRSPGSGSSSGGMDLRAQLDEQVQTNPLRAVLATFVAGFIIGRILR